MGFKVERGLPQPMRQQKKSAAPAARGASFAEGLKAAADRTDKSADAVFARVFSDPENPDLQQLDDYLESLIEKEMKNGGGIL